MDLGVLRGNACVFWILGLVGQLLREAGRGEEVGGEVARRDGDCSDAKLRDLSRKRFGEGWEGQSA